MSGAIRCPLILALASIGYFSYLYSTSIIIPQPSGNFPQLPGNSPQPVGYPFPRCPAVGVGFLFNAMQNAWLKKLHGLQFPIGLGFPLLVLAIPGLSQL
jgi:hypothetical protein